MLIQSTMRIIKSLNQRHKCLVVVRVGDGETLHPTWLNQHLVSRNWDLLVSYYGQNSQFDPGECDGSVAHLGQKWPAVYEIYQNGLLNTYEQIWFPDVDIATDTQTINRLFDLVKLFHLELCQCSLSPNGHWSHEITIQQPHLLMRWTNFVEMMMPVFSQKALIQCAHTFNTPGIGWGLDFVWPKILNYQNRTVGIVDAMCMTHTKPAGSSYDIDTAHNQMWELMHSYQVSDERIEIGCLGR